MHPFPMRVAVAAGSFLAIAGAAEVEFLEVVLALRIGVESIKPQHQCLFLTNKATFPLEHL